MRRKRIEISCRGIFLTYIEQESMMHGRCIASIDTSVFTRDRKITLRDENHNDIAEVYVPINAVLLVSYI